MPLWLWRALEDNISKILLLIPQEDLLPCGGEFPFFILKRKFIMKSNMTPNTEMTNLEKCWFYQLLIGKLLSGKVSPEDVVGADNIKICTQQTPMQLASGYLHGAAKDQCDLVGASISTGMVLSQYVVVKEDGTRFESEQDALASDLYARIKENSNVIVEMLMGGYILAVYSKEHH